MKAILSGWPHAIAVEHPQRQLTPKINMNRKKATRFAAAGLGVAMASSYEGLEFAAGHVSCDREETGNRRGMSDAVRCTLSIC